MSCSLLRNLWKYGLAQSMPDAFRELDLEGRGCEINSAGMNMTFLFQFTNTNQEQVLSVHS